MLHPLISLFEEMKPGIARTTLPYSSAKNIQTQFKV